MDEFRYGPAFFAINEFHFQNYQKCVNSQEMAEAEEFVEKTLNEERE